MGTCIVTPGCTNPIENQDTGACSSCGRALRKAEEQEVKELEKLKNAQKTGKLKQQKIAPVSEKMAKLLSQYSKEKKEWIKDKRCVVYPDQLATTIHHAMGRIGFADQWARDNNVPLLLDKRHWIPASLEGHTWIETHPEESKKKGWSKDRL